MSKLIETDRVEVHRGPCHCGKGEFLIQWAEQEDVRNKRAQGMYASFIDCRDCDRRFSIIERGHHFVLVDNILMEARHDLRNQFLTLRETFMGRTDVQDLLARMATKLDSFRHKTYIYHFLRMHGLCADVTRTTFTEDWSSGRRWVERHITSPEDIQKVAAALGNHATGFESDLRELEWVEVQMRVPIATIGEPIYESNRDW